MSSLIYGCNTNSCRFGSCRSTSSTSTTRVATILCSFFIYHSSLFFSFSRYSCWCRFIVQLSSGGSWWFRGNLLFLFSYSCSIRRRHRSLSTNCFGTKNSLEHVVIAREIVGKHWRSWYGHASTTLLLLLASLLVCRLLLLSLCLRRMLALVFMTRSRCWADLLLLWVCSLWHRLVTTVIIAIL